MSQTLKASKPSKYATDPYSARVLILKLEQQCDISIRVYDTEHYCMISIDKEVKEDVD